MTQRRSTSMRQMTALIILEITRFASESLLTLILIKSKPGILKKIPSKLQTRRLNFQRVKVGNWLFVDKYSLLYTASESLVTLLIKL